MTKTYPSERRTSSRPASSRSTIIAPGVSPGVDDLMAMPSPMSGGVTSWMNGRTLRTMSDVRHFFRTNSVPIYFVGATPFNLLGIDRWVRNFTFVTYYDGWDGIHPRVFSPQHKPYVEFTSGEQINNWLLENAEVRAFIERRRRPGVRPQIAMVFLDEETERICAELDYDLILPPAALRTHLDSKLVTTRLGNEAGVPSVPNILITVDSWAELAAATTEAGLGTDLVVQTAYGDSGKTTFFMDSEKGWNRARDEIAGIEVKAMKRIDNHPIAVEAVITRQGTVVGPFMTELTGHAKLTPYRGGWCGNEMFPGVMSDEVRSRASALVRRLGDRLGQEGYRGFFEVDLLIDAATDEVYLGELNPRISGASSITGVTAGAYADVPLFCFHLLEFLGVDFDLDLDEVNQRWLELASEDEWSQMIVKETGDVVERITSAAPTGLYRADSQGNLVYRRGALDWHQLQTEDEIFFLRVYGAGDYLWKGADLGIVVARGRLQRITPQGSATLTIRAKHLIDSIRSLYRGVDIHAPTIHDAVPLTQ